MPGRRPVAPVPAPVRHAAVRIIAFFEYAAILAGLLGVAAGYLLSLPGFLHFGVFLIGAGIALGGLESVVTRRMGFRAAADEYEAYAGAPALIAGLMALLAGACAIASAYLLAEGRWQSALARLAVRPGPALIGAGALAGGAGALMMLNPRGRRGLAWTLFVRVPRAVLGALVLAAAAGAVGLGAWEWLDPRAFDRWVDTLPREFDRLMRSITRS
ncbi:MAG: hypothetical protein IT529_11150 [Burkholderiales bacterium]|nr:hypothetical protein [Burkholderiales bacterium]